VYAAHRAAFEQSFLPGVGPFICTWKVAVTLAPNAPGHSLQELRYWLKLDVDRAIADRAHRAGPDAYVCAALLLRMLASGKMTVEQMIELSAGPVVLPKLHFGKHAGVPVREVPRDYWQWCLRQEMDADVLHTARVIIDGG
jgi:exodeoxyribonuclease X